MLPFISGNLINDAIVWYYIKQKKLYGAWALAPMAAKNGGSITATLEAGKIGVVFNSIS